MSAVHAHGPVSQAEGQLRSLNSCAFTWLFDETWRGRSADDLDRER